MAQTGRERQKLVFDTWSSNKSWAETARIFGITSSRVHQIVEEHKQRLINEQNLRSSNDPLYQALSDGKISSKIFNGLVRDGYGKKFGFENLVIKLRTNSLDPWEFRNFGIISLTRLRNLFLSQEEIEALNHMKNNWPLCR